MHFDGSRYVVQSAYRPAGGGWKAPTVLSEPGEEGGDPHIALDAQGDAMVAWRGESGGEEVARAAYRPAGGSWQGPTDVSTEGEEVQALRVALNARGDAILAWAGSTHEAGGYDIAQAAYRPVGGSWEAPTELSEGGGNAFPSDVAFDASGNAAVVWERSNGTDNIAQAAYQGTGGTWEAPTEHSEEGANATDTVLVLDAPGQAGEADGDATAVWTSESGASCEGKPECENSASLTVQAAGYDADRPPSEVLEVPATGAVGTPVEVSVPSVDIWSPMFDFGDGASAASTDATHTYTQPGRYAVKFTSTEVLGYRTSTQRITPSRRTAPRVPKAAPRTGKGHCREHLTPARLPPLPRQPPARPPRAPAKAHCTSSSSWRRSLGVVRRRLRPGDRGTSAAGGLRPFVGRVGR